jgi:hypothetical protein
MVGALANLGHHVSAPTVGKILKRHGIAPAPKRSQNTTWTDFIATGTYQQSKATGTLIINMHPPN